MITCVVVGGGAWGTALAEVLARSGHPVTIWARERDVVDAINDKGENGRFLPGVRLSSGIRATADLSDAVRGGSLVTYAAPSHVLRMVIRESAVGVGKTATVVVATKGIERESLAVMSDVASAELPGRPVVALSGPSFAAEVAAGQPTAVVAASAAVQAANDVQGIFSNRAFRVYSHDDVLGVELGGALKNVFAVATGITEGLGLGFNSRAALITRGLAEMTRLGTALGARASTFAGLAGVGDLVLTCTGTLSRNRAVGLDIGRGKTLVEALAGKETVAEGVMTTQSARALADREGVEMPIVDAMHRVLFDGEPAREAMNVLLARELRAEEDR